MVLLAGIVTAVMVATRGDAKEPAFDGIVAHLVLGDYSITGELTVPSGNTRLEAVNQGGLRHNVGIRGGRMSGEAAPLGGKALVDVGFLAPGTYQLYCDLVGHVEKGMVATLTVTEPVTTTTTQ